MIYYAEWENSYGYRPPRQKSFVSDDEAIKYYVDHLGSKLQIIYKESDSEDGFPFIEVWPNSQ